MTTDGQAIKEGLLCQIARHLGRQGGYLSEHEPDTITGSLRGWQLPLPPKTLYQTPEQPATANPSSSSKTTGTTATRAPQPLKKSNNERSFLEEVKTFGKNLFKKPLRTSSESSLGKPVSQPSEELKESDDIPSPLKSETTATALAANPSERAEPGDYEQPGHLASLSLLYDSDVLHRSALLHRTATPQQTDLNQMETDLNLQEHQISFEKDHYTGALRASKMEITSQDPGQPKQQVTLACDDSNPTITINRGSKTLEITAQKISFPGSLPPKSPEVVRAYSPPELHCYWNKVAYYELSDQTREQETEDFTQSLCQQPAEPSSSAPTLGRLFMLGFQKQRTTLLYLCATNQAGQKAHLLQEMKPPE